MAGIVAEIRRVATVGFGDRYGRVWSTRRPGRSKRRWFAGSRSGYPMGISGAGAGPGQRSRSGGAVTHDTEHDRQRGGEPGDETAGWLTSPLGQAMLDTETDIVADVLATVFGFQCLQVGHWGAPDRFLPSSKTLRKALVAPAPGPGVSLVSTPAQLAVSSDSIDVVLLPHTLERDPEPHQVLREVQRVLVGDGHLLVLGFNPFGPWGARRVFSRGRFPVGVSRTISERRLRDWLTLLGLEVVEQRRYLFPLPVNHAGLQRRMQSLEATGARFWPRLSGAYLLLARKRVYSMTPLRPLPAKKRRVSVALPEPTLRHCA